MKYYYFTFLDYLVSWFHYVACFFGHHVDGCPERSAGEWYRFCDWCGRVRLIDDQEFLDYF